MYSVTSVPETKTIITHKKEKIEFFMKGLVNGKVKSDFTNDTYYVLNKYLDYKGDKFKQELFDKLKYAKDMLLLSARNSVENMPLTLVHDILDMFDLNEITTYIRENKIIKLISGLKEVYDQNRELNDEGSREQTFLIHEYYELIGLLTILKSTLPVIAEYATINTQKLDPKYKEYILLNYYLTHPISQTPPFIKLEQYIQKLINIVKLDNAEISKRIIETLLSVEEYPNYILGLTLFNRLLVTSEIVTEDESKNIISKLYNFVKNRIKLKSMSVDDIKFKNFSNNAIENQFDIDSKLEQYRVPTDVTVGSIKEFEWVYSNGEYLLKQLNLTEQEHHDMYLNILSSVRTLKNKNILPELIYLTSWILNKIIDPRSIMYVTIDELLPAIAASATWCIAHDNEYFAKFLTSYISEDIGMDKINYSSKAKIRPELREQLKGLYPYHYDFIEDSITNVIDGISRSTLVSVLPDEILDTFENKERILESTYDLRNLLAELIITINTKNNDQKVNESKDM